MKTSYKLKKELLTTKNKKFVDIPMNGLVLDCFQKRKQSKVSVKEEDLVFPVELLKSACSKLRRRCRSFSIKPLRFHDLRHTFASCLAMAGVPLMVIKELMRHQSYQMTLRYAHLHPDHLTGSTDVLCLPQHGFKQEIGHENSPWSRNLPQQKSAWS